MDKAKEEAMTLLVNEMGITVREDNAVLKRQLLIEEINQLLQKDFQKLVAVLYRLDVSETKLKNLLIENPSTDAALIIADLMIDRQVQKIKSRQQYRKRDNDIDDNERW